MVKPIIVTFYSFRGGVGRSMAMLNVGCLLAQSGRRVLLVDFDLEAPGLTHLIDRYALAKKQRHAARTKGLVDILYSYLFSPESSILKAPFLGRRLTAALVELDVPESTNPFAKGGSLHLMPAGRQRGYEKCLDQLYMSSREFKDVRKAFATRFREVLLESGRFEYIFIDARTGFSDEGYIAAKFLCDHLIVLSGLNDQNIKGTAEFLTKVAAWKKQKHGPDKVLLVASPVCEYEDDRKKDRYDEARKILEKVTGADIGFTLSLPYHPRLALYEELVALRWPDSGLGRAYQGLEYIIRDINEDTVRHWARRAQEALDQQNVAACADAFDNLAAIDRDRAVDLARQTSVALAGLTDERAKEVLPIFDRLAKIDPDEPLHLLQAARLARDVSLDRKEVLKRLNSAGELASKKENLPALAAIIMERARTLADFDSAGARDAALEAFEISERLGTQETSISALLLAAQAEERLCDYSAAVAHAERALSIARRISRQYAISSALTLLTSLYVSQANYASARETCEELLKIARKSGDRQRLAVALGGMAVLDHLQGDWPAARKKEYNELLEIARERADRPVMAAAFHGLALINSKEGSFAKARKQYTEALTINCELGDDDGVATTLNHAAHVDRLQGAYTAARKRAKESLRIFRKLRERKGIDSTLHTIATLDRLQGNPSAARKAYQESLNIARDQHDPSAIASILHGSGELERCIGNYSKALDAFDEALRIHQETGLAFELALLKARREAAYVQLHPEGLLTKLRSLVKRASRDPAVHVVVQSLLLLGNVERDRGHFQKALATLKKAFDKAQRIGMRDLVAFCQAEQAICLSKLGQKKEATQAAKSALAFFKEQHVRHPQAAKLRKLAGAATNTKRKRGTKKPKS